jgi:hypothetical protein
MMDGRCTVHHPTWRLRPLFFLYKEIIIHNKAVVQTGVTARVMHPPISQSLH